MNINRCYEASQMMCRNDSLESRICELGNLTLFVQYHQLKRSINFYTFPRYERLNPEITALSLCYVEAMKLLASDLSCGQKCSPHKIQVVNTFNVMCSGFPPMINNLTVILFRLRKPVGTELCTNMSDYKFALINITGKLNKNTMTLSVVQE